MTWEEGFDRVTEKTMFLNPLLSSTTEASLIEIEGSGSLFRIVPCAWPLAINAFNGLAKVARNVSSCSKIPSPKIVTGMFAVVAPAGIVTGCTTLISKSAPAVAVTLVTL